MPVFDEHGEHDVFLVLKCKWPIVDDARQRHRQLLHQENPKKAERLAVHLHSGHAGTGARMEVRHDHPVLHPRKDGNHGGNKGGRHPKGVAIRPKVHGNHRSIRHTGSLQFLGPGREES